MPEGEPKEPGKVIDFSERKKEMEAERERKVSQLRSRIQELEAIQQRMNDHFSIIRTDGPDEKVWPLQTAINELGEHISKGYELLSAERIDDKALDDYMGLEWMDWDKMPNHPPNAG